MGGRRQQLSDMVLGFPATLWAKLPEYVFEAVVKHFQMHSNILKYSITASNAYFGKLVHGVVGESSTVSLGC
jgi:hypothetical protein